MIKYTCAKAPCRSCPYRKDVPSGVWAANEYDKLPIYDGDIMELIANKATALFFCHSDDQKLCAGWVGVHAPTSLALRLHHHKIDPSVFEYESPVPLFASGQEASDHGKRDIPIPGSSARGVIKRLIRKRKRRSK